MKNFLWSKHRQKPEVGNREWVLFYLRFTITDGSKNLLQRAEKGIFQCELIIAIFYSYLVNKLFTINSIFMALEPLTKMQSPFVRIVLSFDMIS